MNLLWTLYERNNSTTYINKNSTNERTNVENSEQNVLENYATFAYPDKETPYNELISYLLTSNYFFNKSVFEKTECGFR